MTHPRHPSWAAAADVPSALVTCSPPSQENFDTGTALLRVSDSGVEVLDVTTAPCPADLGIPDDVAAEIAPPGTDPNAACGTPVEAEPGFPVQAEPDFTG